MDFNSMIQQILQGLRMHYCTRALASLLAALAPDDLPRSEDLKHGPTDSSAAARLLAITCMSPSSSLDVSIADFGFKPDSNLAGSRSSGAGAFRNLW